MVAVVVQIRGGGRPVARIVEQLILDDVPEEGLKI